jgi:PAS domain S-box-containing protein
VLILNELRLQYLISCQIWGITENIKLQEKINECKKAEKKLRESEERYKKLLEGTFDLVQSVKKDGSFMFVSDNWLSTLGYTKEDLRKLSVFDVIHPRHLPSCREMFSRVFSGEILKNIETSFISSDGGEIILRGNAVPRYLDGEIIGTQGFFQDITEQRKLEHELHLTQFAIDNSLDASFWLNSKAHFIYVNRSACKSLGYSREELLSMTIHDIDPNFPRKAWKEHWDNVKKNKHFIIESSHRKKNGKHIPVEIAINYIKFGDAEYNCAFARDISERKKKEQQLQQAFAQLKEAQNHLILAEKMEIVGNLASGVAHEVKNPLAIIIQCVEYLETYLETEDNNILEMLEYIKDATKNADEVVKGLLDFSRTTELSLEEENIHDIIDESLVLIKNALDKNHIEVKKDFATNIPVFIVDSNKIKQVFLDIVMNSIHSMPSGGTLALRTYTKNLTEDSPNVGYNITDCSQPGDRVIFVEIKDTGTGIPKEHLNKVFDPYFTTKRA